MKTAYEREGFDLVMERYLGISNQPHAELVVRDGSVVFYRDGYMRIYTPKKVEWSGEGPPPVGTVCEFEVETGDWRSCEVIAHKGDYAICWIHVNKIYATGGAAIRPIRTPEQIAAEERDAAAIELAGILSGHDQHTTVRDIEMAKYLYDIGYRKQVKP